MISFLDPYIEYGPDIMEIEDEDLVIRPRGLDTTVQVWQTPFENSFASGGAPPRRPHMRLKEVNTKRDGNKFIHRLQAEGLATAANKIESNRVRQPEAGWDEGPMSMLTVKPESFVQGQAHPLYPSLVLLASDKEDINGHVWRIDGDYKGILGPKAIKRTYSAGGQEVTATTAYAIMGHVGDTAQKWKTIRLQLGLTEQFLSLAKPPTELIGKFLEVSEIPGDLPLINGSPVDTVAPTKVYNFPYFWRVRTIDAVRLLEGRPEHDVTIGYEFVYLYGQA